MKICVLCEGSYPYVLGGVSSWVQQLIRSFPEYEFVLYCIGADSSQKGDYKYVLPDNVTGVTEVFLNEAFIEKPDFELRDVPAWELEELRKLMLGNPDKWEYIFRFFTREQGIVSKFLMSGYFYEIAAEIYKKNFEKTVFVDFLWSLRSMYLTLFHVLNNPPPKADLYHSVSTGYAGIAAGMAKYLYGSGYLLTEHGIYMREREEDIIKADWVEGYFKNLWIEYFQSICFGAYKYADKIVSLFEDSRVIQKGLGAPREKTEVVANGINTAAFADLPGKPEWAKDGPNVGAVIRVAPIKDIKTMIQAFHIVKSRVPGANFYIMGPTEEAPEYYEECKTLLEGLGTKDVYITGKVNVREYLGWMDVMVLTSISEGQPLALMEAMAAGKPNVATNVGCCRELLEGAQGDTIGSAGIIAPVMNHEKIAEAIITLIKDPELRVRMGKNAKKRIETHYSEKQFIENYKRLYAGFDTDGGQAPPSSAGAHEKHPGPFDAPEITDSAAGQTAGRITAPQPSASVPEADEKSHAEQAATNRSEVPFMMRKKFIEQKLGDLQSLNQLLEDSLENTRKELAKAASENKVLAEKNKNLDAQHNDRLEEIRGLNSRLDDQTARAERLEARLREQIAENEALRRDRDNAAVSPETEEELRLAKERADKLAAEAEEARTAVQRAGEAAKAAAAETERLKSELDRVREELLRKEERSRGGYEAYGIYGAQPEKLGKEIEMLRSENKRLELEIDGYASKLLLAGERIKSLEEAAAGREQKYGERPYRFSQSPEPEHSSDEIAAIIIDAHKGAKAILVDAKVAAERILDDSKSEAQMIIASARASAKTVEADARASAQTVIEDAERRSHSIIDEARGHAAVYKSELLKVIKNLETDIRTDK